MKSTTSGMYKRGRLFDETSSIKNSEYSSRGGVDQLTADHRKKTNKLELDEKNWMGSPVSEQMRMAQSTQQQASHSQSPNPFQLLQSAFQPQQQIPTPKSTSTNSKAPTQLIQDILKGMVKKHSTKVNPFYSEESEEKLTEILTNRNKLEGYMSELESEMGELSPEIVKNYEILIILLKELGKSDIEVKQSSKGLELDFNRRQMMEQQNQIERLERKIEEKDEHIKEIVEEYESVIRNFNDVLSKLVEEKEKKGGLRKDEEAIRFTAGFK